MSNRGEIEVISVMLEELKNEIKRLENALELLNDVWRDCGPYENTITDETRYKLQDFFDFDDSE